MGRAAERALVRKRREPGAVGSWERVASRGDPCCIAAQFARRVREGARLEVAAGRRGRVRHAAREEQGLFLEFELALVHVPHLRLARRMAYIVKYIGTVRFT